MNYRMIKYTLGWLLMFEAAFFLIPMITAVCYGEWMTLLAFAITGIICLGIGWLCVRKKPEDTTIYAREGFVIVSLCWIILSVFGALPFIFSGSTTSFIDALFETTAGFTTTGSSIFTEVESLPKAILMWRSFTHWIGGMGVLVFIMAFLPLGGGQNMHIMRAESPGPEVSKLVPRVKHTAVILYSIYLSLTVIMLIVLLVSGMSLFDAINTAFATAGTGGFGFRNDSFASFSALQQVIVTVGMLVFSINFNSYYLILKLKFRDAINSEVRAFVLIVATAIGIITLNIYQTYLAEGKAVTDALRDAAFSVASLISTTGFSTADFDLWPGLSKTILVLVMFIGACAGSTGGGMKVSRLIIAFKGFVREINTLIHPRQVKQITIDKRPVDREVVRSVNAYLACYILVFVGALMLISLDNKDLVTNFTAVTATINNIGPGLAAVGPTANFAHFSGFSKLVMTFTMIAGRLELFPMLILFSPNTWKKG
ncbi:MAG: TrkH family potassium uptake protein [Clostridia bacterium]|nr:TrkH family potassium uptake protein [Clostridia bacterium]